MKINGDYKYFDSDTKNQFLLHLNKNGNFMFEITTYFTSDLLSGKMISNGKYDIKRNKLILTDSKNGYLVFDYQEKYLKGQYIYKGLINKTFNLECACNDSFEVTNRVEKKNINFDVIVNNSNKLKLGLYYSDFDIDVVHLIVEKSQKFKYIFNNFTLLDGVYKLKDNELYLFVPELKYTFKFKITNGKIIDNFIYPNYSLKLR
jgi:hypothetical protein